MGIVLIETSWNVKTSQDIERMEEEKVLIETSWNVKLLPPYHLQIFLYVLIETSWNVKKSVDTVYVVSVSY